MDDEIREFKLHNKVGVYRWLRGQKIIGIGDTQEAAMADLERVFAMIQTIQQRPMPESKHYRSAAGAAAAEKAFGPYEVPKKA